MEKLIAKASTMTVEELKKTAIALKDSTATLEIMFADKINDILIEKLPGGEFSKFADSFLF